MTRELEQVTCYSGYTYAERPVSFIWEGFERTVKNIEKEWQEPGARRFRVKTDDDRTFELCYDVVSMRWLAEEWSAKSERGAR